MSREVIDFRLSAIEAAEAILTVARALNKREIARLKSAWAKKHTGRNTDIAVVSVNPNLEKK